MSAQPCSPQDIREINKSKEYTLISTALLESILTDTRLNAQSVKLWQLLFNQARYNPNFDIKVSYSYLSKILGKSTRSIARYIETLQIAGYIIITHNFDKNGGQRPSTLSLRMPQIAIKHAKSKKDRSYKNKFINNASLISKNTEEAIRAIENSTSSAQLTTFTQNTDVLHGTTIDIDQFISKSDTTPSVKNKTCINKEVTTSSQNKNDKIVMEGNDKTGIQNNIDIKEINNNNNVVSFSSKISIEDSQKLSKLTKEIDRLKKLLEKESSLIHGISDHSLRYDQIKKASEIEARLQLARIAFNRLQKNINESLIRNEQKYAINTDPFLVWKKPGDRPLSLFSFKRLVKTLTTYGYEGNKLNKLINEIVFEARFGSLTCCNISKHPLKIDKSINIALKLVREKRWTTPALLELNNFA